MEPIRVLVTGASGKMTREVIRAVGQDPGMELVGAVSRQPAPAGLVGPGDTVVPVSADLAELIDRTQPAVVVDFTLAECAADYLRTALQRGVAAVSGTTGFSPATLAELKDLAERQHLGLVIAPNFATGAVLMAYFARLAACHFDFAEIIEMHHEAKGDAPSGTALATAKGMAQARGEAFDRRLPHKELLEQARGAGWEGISIHSVRMPGLVAHQEVIFGAPGQTLTIRHDSIARESFMPGVLLAIRAVLDRREVVFGLEPLLGLA